jgi:hypothetical protein
VSCRYLASNLEGAHPQFIEGLADDHVLLDVADLLARPPAALVTSELSPAAALQGLFP